MNQTTSHQELRVYFGAGSSARAFCINSGTLPDYFVDNDSNLWGTQFLGVTVLRPKELLSLRPSRIVLTSSFVEEIRLQLKTLGYSNEQIVLPPKSMWSLQPFRDEGVRKATLNRMSQFQTIPGLRRPVVVVGGACLGLVRSGDLIPWDDDVDFRASDLDADLIRRHLVADKSFRSETHDKDGKAVALVGSWKFTGDQAHVKTVDYSFSFYDSASVGLVDRFDRYEWIWPRKMFEEPFSLEVGDVRINVPNPPSDYLSQVYGLDWRSPRDDFSVDDYGLDPHS